MNKSKLSVPGKEYRLQPTPKSRGDGSSVAAEVIVLSSDAKGLRIRHLSTGVEGTIFFDAIQDFREPNHLMIKGQPWVEGTVIVVDPGFDERQLDSMARERGLSIFRIPQAAGTGSDDEYEHILTLVSGVSTHEKITELRRLLPIAHNRTNELQIVIGLVTWHDPRENPTTAIQLCTRGMQLSDQLTLARGKAILQSYRALYRTQQFMRMDFEAVFKHKISMKLGIPLMADLEGAIRRIDEHGALIDADLQGSLDLAEEFADIDGMGIIFNNHISSLGLRAMHFKNGGVVGHEIYVERLRTIFNASKDLLRNNGRTLMLGYLYHNAANQLRFTGGLVEAESLAREACRIAIAHKDQTLMQTGEALIHEIEMLK